MLFLGENPSEQRQVQAPAVSGLLPVTLPQVVWQLFSLSPSAALSSREHKTPDNKTDDHLSTYSASLPSASSCSFLRGPGKPGVISFADEKTELPELGILTIRSFQMMLVVNMLGWGEIRRAN